MRDSRPTTIEQTDSASRAAQASCASMSGMARVIVFGIAGLFKGRAEAGSACLYREGFTINSDAFADLRFRVRVR